MWVTGSAPTVERPRRKRCVVTVTPWTILLVLGGIALLVGFYFAIKGQMAKGQTLAGPIPPDQLSGEEPEAYKGDESVMERHAEEWASENKDLGHG
jgi:hypothetical protein